MTIQPGRVFNDGDSATEYSGDGPAALLVRSPNGHRWQIKVSDAGVISATDIEVA